MDKEKFKVVIVGILFNPKERKILIGKNIGEKHFSFLEGDLTYKEELDVGLKRVTTEKTGYIVHNLGTVYAANCLDSCDQKLELYFLCEVTEGEEKPGKNVEELKWIKPSEAEDHLNTKIPTRLKEYIINLG